jgi:copper transport protein
MMRAGRGVAALAAVVLVALVAPAAASAHAYLVKTSPTPGAILDVPPRTVALTYDEAVEPRFAIISVTDARGQQETTAPVHRSSSNPDTLIVPLRSHLPTGWYLIYWRAISVDGHPVQGGFTFAVGPNPGPQPQFVIPNISETATTTDVVTARWAMFLTVMVTIGLFVFRMLIARPLVRRVDGTGLRALTIACCVAGAASLVAVPVYLDIATSVDSLRSAFDVATLVPLFRVTAFGRAYVDLEVCMGLVCLAGAIALWVDRPEREHRSLAELFALGGALAACAAALLVPGLAGHAGQTAPRGLALLFDWSHLVSGSVWLGGLVGLILLAWRLPAGRRVAGLAVCVPRFSNVAFVSVAVLLGSGVGATILHVPVLNALWTTSYGKVILLKVGLLGVAMLFGAVNLLYTKPRLVAAGARAPAGETVARLLRRTIRAEAVLIAAAVLAAAILSSLPPPAAALAQLGESLGTFGPGRVAGVVHQGGYTLRLLVDPNTPAAPNTFTVAISRGGQPLTGADVTLTFEMLDMQMGNEEYQMTETHPGVYSHSAPALVMAGRWGLDFSVTPKSGTPFTAFVVDRSGG